MAKPETISISIWALSKHRKRKNLSDRPRQSVVGVAPGRLAHDHERPWILNLKFRAQRPYLRKITRAADSGEKLRVGSNVQAGTAACQEGTTGQESLAQPP